MLSGIRDIASSLPRDQDQFRRLLGDGAQWGARFEYIVQPSPDGLAQAYILAEDFLAGAPSAMVLGDNLLRPRPATAGRGRPAGAGRHGFRLSRGRPQALWRRGLRQRRRGERDHRKARKTAIPDYAVTGLYFLDGTAPERARQVQPRRRGELEITTLLETYLHDGQLTVERMGRVPPGSIPAPMPACWMRGTSSARWNSGRACKPVAPTRSPMIRGWIDADALRERARKLLKNDYGRYLARLLG